MKGSSGSVFGGMLLITGSCVGAGMLALPILTGLAGFFPSLFVFLLVWVFMTLTGLLLVEVNGWFSTKVNLLSMVGHSMGKVGKGISWVLYLFLFYSLLVAYISGSGSLFSSSLQGLFGLSVPDWLGSSIFVILFGWTVYLGTRTVDVCNRWLMLGKILCYMGLVLLGVQYVSPKLLVRSNPSYMIISLPVLVTAFGFHNMIPSLTAYMKGDLRKVKLTILYGSVFALVIYLIWEILVIGIVPLEGENGIIRNFQLAQEGSQAIAGVLGVSWVSGFAQGLAFFAILTSFLAQALGLVHFLADGLRVKDREKENIWLCVLTLAPPLFLSIIYPQLFFKALGFAGGFCAVILFGIFPVCMIWKGRKKVDGKTYRVPGGKP
ncbi:MAG: tyrosine transporter, partial [Chlamydiae bacterium]|nr:tyrosine transporter [Chlamydiota bacterium]